MKKAILGVDMGHDRLKLVLMKGKKIMKTATVQMPERLIQEGRVASVETMAELIRKTMKAEGMRCSQAAWVIPNENIFVRNVKMPQMTPAQLTYNLPFEFRDYITGESKDYVYDYAMLSDLREMEEQRNSEEQDEEEDFAGPGMELMAVAVPSVLIEEAKQIFRKSGMKLVMAAPAVCSYSALIRQKGAEDQQEYCILDIGYQAIRMYMFRGERHNVTRVLEIGLYQLDDAISEAYNVDVHLAHTYLMTNYDNCQNKDVCLEVYQRIAVELMRTLNFYRFSNPDSLLTDIWLCGGGVEIPALQDAIKNVLDINIHSAKELVSGGEYMENSSMFVQAIGITQN